MGIIDGKAYAIIGVVTSLLLYAIEFFDRNEAAKTWLTTQENRAAAAGLGRAVSGFIVKPIIFMIDGPVGAVVGGIIWPLLAVWLVFLILVLAFAVIAPGIGRAGCAASATC